MSILVFDSGIGGLSVLREVRVTMPEHRFVYVGDDAGFPYGDWEEEALVERMVGLFGKLHELHEIELAIVACNTASTLILPALRSRFAIPFVGTVPAIKPAAERTRSGLITVLATPGTVRRDYVRDLIAQFAAEHSVTLVGATQLARLAEQWMQHRQLDTERLRSELQPCFIEQDGRRTDIVVLGCTHYPFLVNEMRKVAPWPVDWLDPAEAIAQHAQSLVGSPARQDMELPEAQDIAIMTSGRPNAAVQRLVMGFGLTLIHAGSIQGH